MKNEIVKDNGNTPLISDDEIIMMIRLGDPDALKMLHERYMPLINMLATKYARPKFGLLREDLIHRALIAMEYSLGTYRTESGIYFAYIRQILDRNMREVYQDWFQSNQVKAFVSLESTSYQDDQYRMIDHIEDTQLLASPERIFLLNEDLDVLETTFRMFTEIEKFVLLARVNDQSYEEIANALNIPVKKVDNILTKIRQKLRKQLNRK